MLDSENRGNHVLRSAYLSLAHAQKPVLIRGRLRVLRTTTTQRPLMWSHIRQGVLQMHVNPSNDVIARRTRNATVSNQQCERRSAVTFRIACFAARRLQIQNAIVQTQHQVRTWRTNNYEHKRSQGWRQTQFCYHVGCAGKRPQTKTFTSHHRQHLYRLVPWA